MGTSKPRLTNVPLLCALLERPVPIVVSTVAPSGRPQSSVVWVERRGDQLAMFFANRSAKLRNLRQNPALAIIAVDEMNPLAPGVPPYALITGTAEIGAPELEMPDRLARAYGQVSGFEYDVPEFSSVLMTIEHISGMGPVKGGAVGGWL